MAARRPLKPKAQALVQVPAVEDAGTQRALDALASAVQQLQSNRGAAAIPVTGSRSSGDALESLLEALVEAGIIVDETTA
jgi:hypothetical protein